MRLRKLVGAVLLLMLLVFSSGPVTAATLSGGTYTYVVNGEEVRFAFDPIKVADGLLLPIEVFEHFQVTAESTGRSIIMKRHGETALLTLGSETYALNGQAATMSGAPLRLNGRLFVPADLLGRFGVEFSQDETLIVMDDLAPDILPLKEYTPAELDLLKRGRSFSASIRVSSGGYMQAAFTLLSPDLIKASNLPISIWDRARLHRLLKTHTLVMVNLSNTSFKVGKLNAESVYLVGDDRTQYDLVSTVDLGPGSITATLVPGADRSGVLVFPKVGVNTNLLSLYYEPNEAILATFTQVP